MSLRGSLAHQVWGRVGLFGCCCWRWVILMLRRLSDLRRLRRFDLHRLLLSLLLVSVGQQLAQSGIVRQSRRQALGERLDQGSILSHVGRSFLPLLGQGLEQLQLAMIRRRRTTNVADITGLRRRSRRRRWWSYLHADTDLDEPGCAGSTVHCFPSRILRMTTGAAAAQVWTKFQTAKLQNSTLQICPSSVMVWRAAARNNGTKNGTQDPAPRRRRSVVYLESQ